MAIVEIKCSNCPKAGDCGIGCLAAARLSFDLT